MEECYKRIEIIEKKMASKDLSPEQEKSMKSELEEVKKLLAKNSEILKNLHTGNRGNFFIAFAILFTIIMIFILFKAASGDL